MDGSCKRAFKLAFRISGVNVLNVKRILVTNPLGKRILLTPILLVSLTIFSSVSAQETAEVATGPSPSRSEEHTSELQSQSNLVCRLLLEKKKNTKKENI